MSKRQDPKNKATPKRKATKPAVVGLDPVKLETTERAAGSKNNALGLQPKTGRPSKYSPDFAKQAEKLCVLGATDKDLADFFEVTDRTINRWRIMHKDFCRSLKAGKDESDERVERSLYHRAVGYTFEAEEVFQFQGEIVRAKVEKHVPPDTTSMIFWLKNRKPEQWRDKIDMDVKGDQNITITREVITRKV